MGRLALLLVVAACSAKKPERQSPVVEPPPTSEAEKTPDARDSEQSEDSSVELEELELDGHTKPFSADVDGDGKPETVSFSCGDELVVSVGGVGVRRPISISDLVGCHAVVFPTKHGPLLLVIAGEHEEAGPDTNAIFHYAGKRLREVWSASARISVYRGGVWQASSDDCDEAAGFATETTRRMTWDGTSVATTESIERTPVKEGDCGGEP